MEALGQAHHVRVDLPVALAAFHLHADCLVLLGCMGEGDPLAVPSSFQLRDHRSLFKLRDGPKGLPDQDGRRSVIQERIR